MQNNNLNGICMVKDIYVPRVQFPAVTPPEYLSPSGSANYSETAGRLSCWLKPQSFANRSDTKLLTIAVFFRPFLGINETWKMSVTVQ